MKPARGTDYTGLHFGRLTVKGRAGKDRFTNTLWECACECGGSTLCPGYNLKKGAVRSCGCLKRDLAYAKTGDLTGKRYGKLVVDGMCQSVSGKRLAQAACTCDCRAEFVTSAAQLKIANGIQSCGCGAADRLRELGHQKYVSSGGLTGGVRFMFTHYKAGARDRSLSWNLTIEEFASLTSASCRYCGAAPNMVYSRKTQHPYVANGVDRVDNALGYDIVNAVPCCSPCNIMKWEMGVEAFLSHIDRIHAHTHRPQSS